MQVPTPKDMAAQLNAQKEQRLVSDEPIKKAFVRKPHLTQRPFRQQLKNYKIKTR